MKEILFYSKKSPSSEFVSDKMDFQSLIKGLNALPKQTILFSDVPLENYKQIELSSYEIITSNGVPLNNIQFLLFSSN